MQPTHREFSDSPPSPAPASGMRFRSRSYQQNFRGAFSRHEYLFYYKVWHRQAGKDDCDYCTVMQDLILEDTAGQIGDYVYVFPEFEHGKKALWEKVCAHNIRMVEHVPEAARAGKNWLNEATMKLWLRNGTSLQVVGARYPNKLRGPSYRGVVISEWAQCNPGVENVFSPMLRANGGWMIKNTTPYGKNHAYDDWLLAQKNPDAWCELLTIDQTVRDAPGEARFGERVFGPKDIALERARGMTEEWIQQEYYCSWTAPMDGSIHGRLMEQARNQRRVGIFPHNASLPVLTGWDIHNTAIWFAQVAPGPVVLLIDYEFVGGQTFQEIVPKLFEKHRRDYIYKMHYFPADMHVKDYTAEDGRTRLDIAKSLLGETKVFAPTRHSGIQDRIDGAAWVIKNGRFNEDTTREGIKALESYHKEYDEDRRIFRSTPVKDWASHGADALGEIGLHIQANEGTAKPPPKAELDRHRGGGSNFPMT